MFITLPDERPFAFAGLWDIWQDKSEPGSVYCSCTIITRETVGDLRKIHDRMPVVLQPDSYKAWMDHDGYKIESLQEILSRNSVTEFAFYPVSKNVNAVRNNEPGNIEPVEVEMGG